LVQPISLRKQIKNDGIKPSFFIGTREAKSFEPLMAISDWLLNNSRVDWLFTKPDASMIGFVPQYRL